MSTFLSSPSPSSLQHNSLTPSQTSSTSQYTPTSSTPPPPSQHTQSTPPSQTTPATFSFPRTHSFPPFYTLQPNASTLHAQLQKWSSLILSYCQFHRITKLSLSTALETDLFWNRTINRRLERKDLDEIVRFMRKEGTVENVSSGGKRGKEKEYEGSVVWVWWRSVEEWGSLIENWVAETGQKNTVLTLYELTESDATIGQDFHGLNPELLQKALAVLVKRGKAQIFGQEDSQGIKFF